MSLVASLSAPCTTIQPVITTVSNSNTEKRMLVKSALVFLYTLVIDKFVFGEPDTMLSLKFGAISGASYAVTDKVISYAPEMLTLDQASSFEKIITNNTLLSYAGSTALTIALVNRPYGKVSQGKQMINVVFSEVLADYVIKKYMPTL